MIKKDEKGEKICIYIKDEITRISWEVEVKKEDFEWCVKKKQELGFEDPITHTMLDYALFDQCAIPNISADQVQKFLDEIKG